MVTSTPFLRKALCMLLAGAVTTAATAQTITFYHNDVSGSPMVATDASGNVVWKESYRPYGEKMVRQPASASNTIGFHNRPFDDSTGLSYMGARYYDPVVGRFMGIDPEGFDPANIHSFNRYSYANNNPYKYVDPDGRAGQLVIAGIGVLFVTALFMSTQSPQQREQQMASISRAIDAMLSSGPKGNPTTNAQTTLPTVITGAGAPDPNEGDGGKHGRPEHDKAIRDRVDTLRQDPDVKNIRMNQQQVDVNGNRVGTNRPDLQYDKLNKTTNKWEHHNIEWDYKSSSSQNHQTVIRANDPKAVNEFKMLP